MNRYAFSYRWQLVGIGLLGLLALAFLLFTQASSLDTPVIQGRAAGNEAPSGAADVELLTGIHPADRKFYGDGYAIYGGATGNAYTWDSVHPADRKFLHASGSDADNAAERVHPADRKFFMAAAGSR